MNMVKKILALSLILIFSCSAILTAQTTMENKLHIVVSKGKKKLKATKGSKVLTIGNMQLLVKTSQIANVKKDKKFIVLKLANGDTYVVSKNVISMPNNRKIVMKNKQSLDIMQATDSDALVLTPFADNKGDIKVRQKDAKGDVKTVVINKGDKLGLNADNTVSVIQGKVTVIEKGQKVDVKQGQKVEEALQEKKSEGSKKKDKKQEIKPKPKKEKKQEKQEPTAPAGPGSQPPANEPGDFGNDLNTYSKIK